MASSYWDVLCNLSCIPIKRCRCMIIGQNSKIILFFFCLFFVLILLLKHGDIEINPRPKKKLVKFFHVVTGM